MSSSGGSKFRKGTGQESEATGLRRNQRCVARGAYKGVARLRGGKVDRSSAERRVSRGAEWGGVRPSGRGLRGAKKFLLHVFKMEHFCVIFKLDLTEETRMQLQEEEAYWLRLWPRLQSHNLKNFE